MKTKTGLKIFKVEYSDKVRANRLDYITQLYAFLTPQIQLSPGCFNHFINTFSI